VEMHQPVSSGGAGMAEDVPVLKYRNMNGDWLLTILRALVATVGLVIVVRLVLASYVYLSTRVFAFLGLAVLSYLLIGFFRFVGPLVGLTLDAGWVSFLEILYAVGIVGCLWEQMRADQKRYSDSQKLMEQWRQASNLANKQANELAIFSEISRELASSLDLREVLEALVERGLRLGDADAVTVFVRNRETGELTDYRVTAAARDELKHLPPPRPDGLTNSVARSGEAAFIGDARTHPLYADGAYPDLCSIASLPLRFEGEVVGVMNMGYIRPHQFDDEEIRLFSTLADAAAVTVNNAAMHERILRLAVTDDLTGLANRRRFLEVLRSEMHRARRYGRPLTLLMVDLDRLKQINDQYGHAAGDAMLRGVAQCMRSNVRDTDLPARLGGDEFAVLFPETSGEAAVAIAERIRASVENFSVAVDDATVSSTVSIGLVSRSPGDLHDLPSFIRLADDALYRSKIMGRNAVTTFDAVKSKD
jgi:diguanylate cyclase (GGDEF)-like protein